jgi:SNF2 family DNA or RNA helicase
MGNRQTLTWKGLRWLVDRNDKDGGESRILAMTATPFSTSPYNHLNIFSWLDSEVRLAPDPFERGPKASFEDYYVKQWDEGGKVAEWREDRLPILGKRIERIVSTAMKDLPHIAAQFPELAEDRVVPVEMSDNDMAIYRHLVGVAEGMWDEWDMGQAAGAFMIQRILCNTAEGLRFSESPLAAEIVAKYPDRIRTSRSGKFQAVCGLLETLLEKNEKVVVFSFFANATVKPYLSGIRHFFPHTPVFKFVGGMSEDEQQASVKGFNETDGGAIIVCSDAGAEGLNLYASYVVQIELPYTYKDYKQRRDRIHRGDSIAKGITHCWPYYFVTAGSVEERIAVRVEERRRQAELIRQGKTTGASLLADRMDKETLRQLVLGH